MQIGIIGTGHMGGMLARAFAQTAPETVYIYNRSRAKADAVAADMSNIVVSDDVFSLIDHVDVVFLCTKAGDGLHIAQTIGPRLRENQLFVTTISSVNLDRWPDFTQALPVKLIPSLTQTVHRGVLLLSYPAHMPGSRRKELEARLCHIGKPFVVDEAQIRVSSDLASCGPAFLSTVCRAWAQAASLTGHIDLATAESILQQMLIGLGALLESGMSFDEVIKRIRVPGGVTERGIESMEDLPQHLFARVHAETAQFSHGVPHTPVVKGLATPRG